MDRITILGMGPIGASIGLALKQAGLTDTEVVGTDSDRKALSHASRIGAVDRVTGNIRSALNAAQLVILDMPLADIKDVLEAIGPILAEGCVVTDTGIAKVQVMEWARSYLPPGTSFVGGRPLPRQAVTTLDDADAALFAGTEYCVIPAESAPPEAVKTVVGLVEKLGARPLFLDAHEHDSYTAAVTVLPLVLSSALVNTTAGSASWREVSRVAGPEFQEASRLAAGDPRDIASACLGHRDALVYWLDRMIAELHSVREQIKQGDDDLLDTFIRAFEERAKWQAGAVVEEAGSELPSSSQTMAGLVFGGRLVERYRQITSASQRPQWKYRKRRLRERNS